MSFIKEIAFVAFATGVNAAIILIMKQVMNLSDDDE